MEDKLNEILDSDFTEELIRRRKLLPWWIKIFAWIFLVFGAISPFGLIFGFLGMNFMLSLYGIQTYQPVSIIGLFLIGLFLLKGITAYSLLMEKDGAISLAQIDTIIGIAVCTFMMLIYPFINNLPGFHLTFRLELVLLIPFLIKLGKRSCQKLNVEKKE
ncbi:MAG: hypothetical protein K9J13_10825 [Saprospiraceae bacterium]|nr:hypothetical protein [Saprospiraceae bacterium]